AVSYRLHFALQLLQVLFYVTGLYFLSTIIGANAKLDPYGGYLPFAAIGLAVGSYFQTGFDSFSKAIQREQMQGTLEALLMSPLRLPSFLVATSAWPFLWKAMTSLVYVVAAVVLYDIEIYGDPVLALGFLLLTTLVFSSLGIVSASFVMVFKRGDPVGMLVGGVSTLLGGVYYPVSAMPTWMQDLAYLLPITHALDAIRGLLLQSMGLADVLPQLWVLLGFAVVLLPMSLVTFQYAVRRALREGSLLHY
ncbi:MAG TPA: ABC transporter permease, partial [Planctomycetota bacterium]|nr:ABC transporter permease [Planctomycetota bacterium]